MPAPATDRRIEGLRALARLIADAVAPVPAEPPREEGEFEHAQTRPRRRASAPVRDGPPDLGVVQ